MKVTHDVERSHECIFYICSTSIWKCAFPTTITVLLKEKPSWVALHSGELDLLTWKIDTYYVCINMWYNCYVNLKAVLRYLHLICTIRFNFLTMWTSEVSYGSLCTKEEVVEKTYPLKLGRERCSKMPTFSFLDGNFRASSIVRFFEHICTYV